MKRKEGPRKKLLRKAVVAGAVRIEQINVPGIVEVEGPMGNRVRVSTNEKLDDVLWLLGFGADLV